MLNEQKNQLFQGANNRSSLYDVIYQSSDAKLPLILFCHGFKGFKDWGHFPLIARELAEAGFAVVKFNFSHNGVGLENTEEFTDLDAFSENNYLFELEDIDLLMQHLQNETSLQAIVNFKDISIIGHSRGGSIALLKASQDKRIKRVVSWAAVADLEERLPSPEELEEWRKSGVRNILNGRTGQNMPMKYQFVEVLHDNAKMLNVERAVKRMKKPMLIVHGENDQSVTLEHGYALHIWNSSAEFETIETADHTFGGRHPFDLDDLPKESKQLVDKTIQFLRSH